MAKATITSTQLHMLIGLIDTFRHAARVVDEQIGIQGLRFIVEKTENGAPKTTRFPGNDPLLSLAMMSVSHFNLGMALELGLKCLTALNGKPYPSSGKAGHLLSWMYRGLDQQTKESLDTAFQVRMKPIGITWLHVDIFVKGTEPPPSGRPTPRTFEGLCDYFDTEFKLNSKRYSFEDATPEGAVMTYIEDSTGLFEFVEDMQQLILERVTVEEGIA